MKFRSFADVLTKMQGGLHLKPGQTYIFEDVPEETIKKAWGSIPTAIAFEGSTFRFEKTSPGYYRMRIHRAK